MLKLFLVLLSWLFQSGGLDAGQNWLAAPEATSEAPRLADAFCSRGDWPDRARACPTFTRPSLRTGEPRPAETAADVARQEAQAAGRLTFNGGVRFYDASAIVETPVAAETPAGSITPTIAPLHRAAPADRVDMSPEGSTSLAHRPAQAVQHAATTTRRASAQHYLAANTPARPYGLLRIYGVAF